MKTPTCFTVQHWGTCRNQLRNFYQL